MPLLISLETSTKFSPPQLLGAGSCYRSGLSSTDFGESLCDETPSNVLGNTGLSLAFC